MFRSSQPSSGFRPVNNVPLQRRTVGGSRAQGAGGKGLGLGKSAKRHRKILKDTIQGVTKGDIRRLARRGGVKRISATIYKDVRLVIREYLEKHIQTLALVVEARSQKTVQISDVVFSLQRMGRSIYGFGVPERR